MTTYTFCRTNRRPFELSAEDVDLCLQDMMKVDCKNPDATAHKLALLLNATWTKNN